MKSIIILLLTFTICTVHGQKIAEDKVDDFTQKKVLRTEWEKLSTGTGLYTYVRISKIDSTAFLNLKYFTKGVSAIKDGADISFMFEDGEVLSLKNLTYEISCTGCGSVGLVGSKTHGLSIDMLLSAEAAEKFRNKTVTKLRIYETEGYMEDKVKPKNAEVFKRLFEVASL